MTATPWGEAEGLRSQKLPPGPGRSQAAVTEHQRGRLIAATVAVVAERGYEATRIEDIVVMAGVSRSAFYKHFTNKRDCFVASLEAVTAFAGPFVLDVVDRTPGDWDTKILALLDALADVIVAQPAVARVGWVEVYAAGPEAIEVMEKVDRAVEDIVCRALENSAEHAGMPREIIRSTVGAVRKIVHTRVCEGRTDELHEVMPELFAWMRSYHTPTEQLRRPRRVPPGLVAPLAEAHGARERIAVAVIDLVAEKGYPAMSITEIAKRASVSLTTFYANFEGKEEAFLAALDDVQRQVFAATAPHFAAAEDWASGVSAGTHAFLGFLATHPTIAEFGGVGVWTTSPAGLALRAEGMVRFRAVFEEGFRLYPDTAPIVPEAVGAAVDALLFAALRHRGAARVYEIAPTAAFLTLAPFVGSKRACELANSAPTGQLATIGQTSL
jgi:AcrR family transcriptional regulator